MTSVELHQISTPVRESRVCLFIFFLENNFSGNVWRRVFDSVFKGFIMKVSVIPDSLGNTSCRIACGWPWKVLRAEGEEKAEITAPVWTVHGAASYKPRAQQKPAHLLPPALKTKEHEMRQGGSRPQSCSPPLWWVRVHEGVPGLKMWVKAQVRIVNYNIIFVSILRNSNIAAARTWHWLQPSLFCLQNETNFWLLLQTSQQQLLLIEEPAPSSNCGEEYMGTNEDTPW